jgi:hypothetical protein
MFRLFARVQFIYLGIFLAACAGLFAYESIFVWPPQRCEAKGSWWNAQDRECDTPILIWRLTGRAPHRPRPAPKP